MVDLNRLVDSPFVGKVEAKQPTKLMKNAFSGENSQNNTPHFGGRDALWSLGQSGVERIMRKKRSPCYSTSIETRIIPLRRKSRKVSLRGVAPNPPGVFRGVRNVLNTLWMVSNNFP
jgi:hypothetical protein